VDASSQECTAVELTQMGFPPAVVQQYVTYLQGTDVRCSFRGRRVLGWDVFGSAACM
jgi:hypothetical protein